MHSTKRSCVPLSLATILALVGCKVTSAPDLLGCLDLCGYSYTPSPPVVSLVPAPVAGGLSFKAISLGWHHACAVTTAGDAYCWGEIDLGSQQSHTATSPERVLGDFKLDTISVGNGAACGITTDQRTLCWGLNYAGQLGNGSHGPDASWATPVSSPVAFRSIAVGGWDGGMESGYVSSAFACGVTATGTAYCWGSDNLGQLGSGVVTPNGFHDLPTLVAGNRAFTTLAGNGFASTCGLTSHGAALCWGSNALAEFGTDTAQVGAFPPTPVASNLTFVALSTRLATCGITTTGDTYCWGSSGVSNGSGRTPKLVTSIPFVSIAAGAEHACGLTANGTAYCWGSNASGQIGDGTTNGSAAPVLVATSLRFMRIAAGNDQTCALTMTGAAYCWGLDGPYHMLGRSN